ncbi:hypothetical protein [Leucobacter sp.]
MSIVTTVLGAVEPDSLGPVLAAETLLCAPPAGRGNAGRPASEAAFERAPVTMERLGGVMLGAVNRDDRTLDGADAEAALDALVAAMLRDPGAGRAAEAERPGPGRAGSSAGAEPGTTPLVVALAGRGSNAEPALLAALSRASGVAIVRGVGGSTGRGGSGDAPSSEPGPGRDADALAARLAEALSETEHPAGAIGALPVPGDDPRAGAADAARIEAAAAVARDTGVALVLAPRADPWTVDLPDAPGADALRRALAAVDAAGLDRSRVVLAGAAACIARRDDLGSPLTGFDPARLDALLAHGAAVCFDDLGRIPNVRTAVSDHDVALAILRGAERGAGDRIMLSTGIRSKHRLTAFGGNGLEFVSQQFLPYLRVLGAGDGLVRAVGGASAARVLGRATAEGAAA